MKISPVLKFATIALLGVGALIIFVSSVKTKKFFSCIFLTAIQGIAAIFAVNVLGMVTGIHLAVNQYTIITSLVGGTPAVIAMMAMKILFK